MTASGRPVPDVVKACCAAAYQHEAVALLLGESYHPGGPDLTRRLAAAMDLAPGSRVLDVASGPGSTALLLAAEFGCTVEGVDLGEQSIQRATHAAAARGLSDRVRFTPGDAEALPFPDDSFDAVVCECSLCTFPDKARAAAELARVLRPRGRVGITDVTLTPGALPAELADLAGWVACLADAQTATGYAQLLHSAGLVVTTKEDHSHALAELVDRVEARLRALRMAARAVPALSGVDLDRVIGLVQQAAAAIDNAAIGYSLLVAAKPDCTPGRRPASPT